MAVLAIGLIQFALVGMATAATIYVDEVAFLSASGPLDMESFEDLNATNTRNLSGLTLDDFSMTINSGDYMGVFDDSYFFGGHPTDGDQYVGFTDGHDYVDFLFDTAIDTFGINIIDFGDFGPGSLTFSNNVGDSYTIDLVTYGALNNDNNDQFFGIMTDFSFTNVRLTQTISGEFYAVDEVYFGNQTAPVPEPATMLLLCTGLFGFAGSRFRKNKK